MILNRAEKLLVNNPLRGLLQRQVEARRLLAMGGAMGGGRALEVGCGPGFGLEIILDRFGAGEVDAFDLDPAMVEMAKERLRERGGRVNLWTGDATQIKAEDGSYDAVFDFFVIHHVPNWRLAVREIYRVLKPGGRLYAGEILEGLITNPLARHLFDHPQEDRFDGQTFAGALTDCGFRLVAESRFGHWAAWFVADKPL